MVTFFISLGYVGLFLACFLGATLLPGASEVVVIAMPLLGYDLLNVLIVSSIGSFFGSLVTFYIGQKGGNLILTRYKVDPQKIEQAKNLYQKWGVIVLFFAWLPVIGDPLVLVAGTLRINFWTFSFWVLLGKTLRYIVLLGLVNQLFNRLT